LSNFNTKNLRRYIRKLSFDGLFFSLSLSLSFFATHKNKIQVFFSKFFFQVVKHTLDPSRLQHLSFAFAEDKEPPAHQHMRIFIADLSSLARQIFRSH